MFFSSAGPIESVRVTSRLQVYLLLIVFRSLLISFARLATECGCTHLQNAEQEKSSRNVPHRAHQRGSNAAHYSNRYLIFSHSRSSGSGKKSVYALSPVSLSRPIAPRLASRSGARFILLARPLSAQLFFSNSVLPFFRCYSFHFVSYNSFFLCVENSMTVTLRTTFQPSSEKKRRRSASEIFAMPSSNDHYVTE